MNPFLGMRESILFIAGRKAIGEPLTRQEYEMPLNVMISELFADPNLSSSVLALVSACMARHIEVAEEAERYAHRS